MKHNNFSFLVTLSNYKHVHVYHFYYILCQSIPLKCYTLCV